MLERLQKIIARAGIASRRHAEELIRSGQVRVNGETVTELGAKADPERDRVEAAGQVAHVPPEPVYYILYKPPHVVATMSDPEGRATLRHVLRGLAGGVFPVGRLDYAASGLLLLTSDGALADRMFKASGRIPKVYWMKVKGALGHDLLRQIGHKTRARVRPLAGPAAAKRYADNPWYEAELGEARSDLLRSELFAAGHPVEKLKRVKLGPLELGDLAEGHYRQLAPSEVSRLRAAIERAEKAPRPPAQRKRRIYQGNRRNPNAPRVNQEKRQDTSRDKRFEGRRDGEFRDRTRQGSENRQPQRPGDRRHGPQRGPKHGPRPPGRPHGPSSDRSSGRPSGRFHPSGRPPGPPSGRFRPSGRPPSGRPPGRPPGRPSNRPQGCFSGGRSSGRPPRQFEDRDAE